MTGKTFKEAEEILKRIERIKQLRSSMFYNPYIKPNEKGHDYVYLSWVDNEDSELKYLIIGWCDEEIKKLQTKFNEL